MGLTSNNLLTIINFLGFISSIPILATGLYQSTKPPNIHSTLCIDFFRWHLVIIGSIILFLSLLGAVGAHRCNESLLALYQCALGIIIAILITFLVMASVVTRPEGEVHVPGRLYREYRIDGFSEWMRDHVIDDWGGIRRCLARNRFCDKVKVDYPTPLAFFMSRHISPLESGCCKPPTACGYQFIDPTTWVNPVTPMVDQDCLLWNSDQNVLCYYCSSCKAGMLSELIHEWNKVKLILIFTVLALVCIFLIGLSALRNARGSGGNRRK